MQINVGFTEAHGMARELAQFPPDGVRYSFLTAVPQRFRLMRSPIKGYFRRFQPQGVDLIEAVLSPASTEAPWVYSLGNFVEATTFNFLRAPLPRSLRVAYLSSRLTKRNFKRLMFWSRAGLETLQSYGGVTNPEIIAKSTVVYPAVRRIPDEQIGYRDDQVNILFSGDFFRKGGVNVVDAFELAQRRFPGIRLTLCCDRSIDLRTPNEALRREYLSKIENNPGITNHGRVGRNDFVGRMLPAADIFAMPSYVEVFGMAVLEAMAFGIPVVSTNHFAIPEMVEHGSSGLLVDTARFDCDKLFRVIVVNEIPAAFRTHVTDSLYEYFSRLIESKETRRNIGQAGLATVREKFSFERRNSTVLEIYRKALEADSG